MLAPDAIDRPTVAPDRSRGWTGATPHTIADAAPADRPSPSTHAVDCPLSVTDRTTFHRSGRVACAPCLGRTSSCPSAQDRMLPGINQVDLFWLAEVGQFSLAAKHGGLSARGIGAGMGVRHDRQDDRRTHPVLPPLNSSTSVSFPREPLLRVDPSGPSSLSNALLLLHRPAVCPCRSGR
jgi:hypothetical protein